MIGLWQAHGLQSVGFSLSFVHRKITPALITRTAVSVGVTRPPAMRMTWSQRHLLGLEDLSRDELENIFDLTEEFVVFSQVPGQKRTELKGKVVVNLFFEPSTRTRTSF